MPRTYTSTVLSVMAAESKPKFAAFSLSYAVYSLLVPWLIASPDAICCGLCFGLSVETCTG